MPEPSVRFKRTHVAVAAMKFFLPAAKDAEMVEVTYRAIKKNAEESTGWPITDTRYYEIYFRHDGQNLHVRVGDLDPSNGETVIAIFKPKDPDRPFLVCTPNRGVATGDPIFASDDALAIVFEPESRLH